MQIVNAINEGFTPEVVGYTALDWANWNTSKPTAFIKPNVCVPSKPSAGVVVDPEGVKGIIHYLRLKCNVKNIVIGESVFKTDFERSLNHVLDYPQSFWELIYKSEADHKQVSKSECCYGRYIVFIDAEGSIYPCTLPWEYPEGYKPKNIFRDGIDEALRNAQDLPCWICYCPGGIDWDTASSFHGIPHAIKFTLSQLNWGSN